jgi:hypothetical protein
MPKYKLNSGEIVDTSNFSEEEENDWLYENTGDIDLDYDFQNGAVETGASATPVNNPASNGDSISEDGLSDGVNPYSKFNVTAEDLSQSEEEVKKFLDKRLSILGLDANEGTTLNSINAIQLRVQSEAIEDSFLVQYKDKEGMDFVNVGDNKTPEELQASADKINSFIREKGNLSFLQEARKRSGERYENYLDYVTPEELDNEELLIEKRNATAEKFEEIKVNEETYSPQYGKSVRATTIADFASEKEFENYKQWEKTGIIGDFSKEDLLEYDAKRREKYINRKSLDYANDTDSKNRIDILALAADDEEKIQTFELEANNYIALRDELDVAVENYKTNPSNNNYLAALDLQAKALADQGRIQRLQTKMLNSGIADRQNAIPLALSDFGKDYNRVSQLRTQFKNAAVDTGFFLAQLSIANGGIRGQSIASSPLMLNQLIEDQTGLVSLKEDLNKESAGFQRSIMVDEIRSVDEAGMWMASSAVNLIPSLAMAATGPAAMPLFFASSAGGKGMELALQQKEAISTMIADKETLEAAKASGIPLDALEEAQLNSRMEKNSEVLGISAWKAYGIQALYGTAEMVFERLGTISIIKNLSKGLPTIAPTSIKEGFKFVGGQLGKNAAIEGGTEFFTTLAQNFGDIFILGEDKNIFEGALESFAQGALMGGGMSSINVAKGLNQGIVSVLSTDAESKELYSKLDKLKQLTGQNSIQGWADVVDGNGNLINKDLDLAPEIKKQIDEVVSEMKALENGITYRVGSDLSIEQAYKVDEVNRKMRLINKRMAEASQNPNISPSQLKVLKDQFTEKIEALNVQREGLLNDQADISSTKSKAVDAKFNVDNLAGWQSYTFSMARASLGNVLQRYESLPEAEKQKALAEARAELETKNNTPTSDEVNTKAKLNFVKNEYKTKILEGAENAKRFAESKGLDTTFEVFEGKDADKKLLEWAENNSEELVDRKKFEDQDGIVNEAKYQAAIKLELANIRKGLKTKGLEGFNTLGNTVVVHLENSAENGRTGVFAHEVLHSYIRNKYGDDAEIDAAGKNLLSFLEKNEPDLYARVTARVDSSYTTRNKKTGELEKNKDYYEEVMTAMSDALADGQPVSKDLMYRLKKFVNSFLPAAHRFKDDQAREVYEFVKSYNSVAHFGKEDTTGLKKGVAKNVGIRKSKSRKLTETEEDRMEAIDEEIGEISDDLMQGFIDQDTHDKKIAKLEEEYENIENPPKVEVKAKPKAKPKAKKESDIDAPQASKKDEQSLSDVTAKSKKKLDAIGNDPDGFNPNNAAIYEVLAGMIRSKVKAFKTAGNNIVNLTNLPGFEMDNMISETIASLIPYIKKFDPSKNDSLFGYTMAQLGNRMRGALKTGRVTENTFTEDVTAAKGIVAEESSNEVKEKPKFRKFTEASVISAEVIDAIRTKLKSTIRTLKTRMDAAISSNRTITPLMAEIQYEMGKQADIDLKKAMGGKKDLKLRKFLLKNKKTILENLTTTFLMGKDGSGGIPQAIQKKIDGRYVSYPAWVGKKIDRETTSTDNAGRTSGAELVRRVPNVNRVVTDQELLSQVLDETGNPIRGRKEALAKAMGEEISFEIFSADLADPASDISEAFENNQERLGVVLAENFVQQLESDVDRGNIKLSITKTRQKELNKLWANTWLTTSESNRLRAVEELKKKLRKKEEKDYIETVDNMLTEEINEILELNWQQKEQRLVDITNKLQSVVPGLTIKQKTTQKNPNKADLVFSLYGKQYAWEAKGSRNAILATFYMGAWWKGDFKIKRKNVTKTTKDLIEAADQGNAEMQNLVDILEDMYDTGSYINEQGMRKRLYGKDLITKNKDGNFKMPVWFYDRYVKGVYSMGKVNGGAIRKFKIKGGLAAVVKVYNGKGPIPVRYITLADVGDLSMGALDPLNLNLPKLKGDVDVTVRFQPTFSGEKGSRRVTLARVASFKMTAETANTLSKKTKTNLFRENSAKETLTKASKLQLSITKQTAINNAASIKYSQTPKGISVFDFDDTLARTKSNVLYVTADGKKGKLNAAQFAARSETMLAQGVEFDFSEFSKVVKGELGPLFSEAQKKEGKYTNKDIFVLTARPANSAKAIHEFLKSEGLNIPIGNITGLGNGAPQAKADWMVSKIAEGYNDFYFADDHMGNVKAVGKALKSEGVTGQTELSIVDFKNQPKAVRDILNTFDVKGPTQRSRVKFSRTSNKTINDMLERASGIPSRKRLTQIEGAELGKKKGRFKIWMPSSLEDFRGLTEYTFAGKGRQGDIDQKFIRDALVTPYWRGINEMDQVKQSLKNGFAALNKQFKPVLKKLGKKMPGMEYTHDQAIRVYLWNKAGYEIPGLTKKLERTLVAAVQADADLLAYANGALRLSQRKQWSKPSDYWNVQTILSDINNFTEKAGRKEYLKEFIDNADLIFSEKNLNKIEAIYGKAHREAIEDILYRMKNGTNRAAGMKKNEQTWNNWLNNSIGAIMFFNRRSALLQLLSTVNFVNWSDNNPMKAAAAFANQKQFWSDFAMIFNSAKLKQRRSGLKTDVNAAELASAVTGAKDKASAALNYLLKIGFTPTQMVDSFAISSGGATFYRNRVNTYLKEKDAKGKPKYTQKEAEKQAFEDFSKISDETQQSGDPALISSDQSSSLGRVVLNFMNTPIQLNRSIKKSAQNIYKRRREPGMTQMQSDFSNFSKIIYYGTIQNAIFSTLQAAMFALIPGFNDDDEELDDLTKQEKIDKKTFAVINSMVDTTLKGGFGLPGAVVSILKNAIIEYKKQEDRGFLADDSKTLIALLNISPAVGSKGRKIVNFIKTERFDKEVINERGWDVTIDGKFNLSPRWSSAGNLIEGTLNIPVARVVDELNSITEALDSRNTAYQRIALALGWKTWNVGAKNEENDLIEVVAKYRNKLKKKAETKAKKAAEKLKERRANIQY